LPGFHPEYPKTAAEVVSNVLGVGDLSRPIDSVSTPPGVTARIEDSRNRKATELCSK